MVRKIYTFFTIKVQFQFNYYGFCSEKVPDEKPTEQLSKDYEPYAHRQVKHPLTNNETLVHLLKNELATGIFSMPNAFHQAGKFIKK